MRFASVTLDGCSSIFGKVEASLKQAKTLEQAAGHFVETLYTTFAESLVLVRMFVSIPFLELPAFNRQRVSARADDLGLASKLSDNTPVLSLLATRGIAPAWNDRKQSQGHVGIPCLSREHVETIPMISRMISELGYGFNWLKETGGEFDPEATSGLGKIFHVPHAQRSTDEKNRLIIPAQDFVQTYGVKTVFGIGGRYMIRGNRMVVTIFFTKEEFGREIAQSFSPLISHFKSATVQHVIHEKTFSAE